MIFLTIIISSDWVTNEPLNKWVTAVTQKIKNNDVSWADMIQPAEASALPGTETMGSVQLKNRSCIQDERLNTATEDLPEHGRPSSPSLPQSLWYFFSNGSTHMPIRALFTIQQCTNNQMQLDWIALPSTEHRNTHRQLMATCCCYCWLLFIESWLSADLCDKLFMRTYLKESCEVCMIFRFHRW